jgi:uncharacterized protein (TIGR00251 family)
MSRPGEAREPGLAFWIHVTPRARLEAVGGRHGDALRVAVREAPESGRANVAGVRALAEAFGVSRARVELELGAKGRRKRVRVTGDPAALERRFDELANRG